MSPPRASTINLPYPPVRPYNEAVLESAEQ
jgi:hypothetical protein